MKTRLCFNFIQLMAMAIKCNQRQDPGSEVLETWGECHYLTFAAVLGQLWARYNSHFSPYSFTYRLPTVCQADDIKDPTAETAD